MTIKLFYRQCYGHWKSPRDCSVVKHDCEYFINWKTVGKGDEVRFLKQVNYCVFLLF